MLLQTFCLIERCESSNLFSPGDHRELEPPDPIPNSTVKRFIADDSVGSPHVKVGHRQAPYIRPRPVRGRFCLRNGTCII